MSLSFSVSFAAAMPTFNAIIAAARLAEPVQLAGAGWTGEGWPKGLYAKVADVASAPSALELTPEVEANFVRAGVRGAFVAFVRGSARGVVVSRGQSGVTFRVPPLAAAADYALAVRLAAAAARLENASVEVDEGGGPEAGRATVAPDDLGARYDAVAADAHARRVGTWLVDDMAQERTYWFPVPRGWVELGPDDLGGVPKEERFDRARALLAGGDATPPGDAPSGDARREAVLLTAAMVFAAGADGRLDEEESRQLEAHFATVKELGAFAPRELLDAVRAEVSSLQALEALGTPLLRRKAFVLAGEVIASARLGKLTGEASDPNVQAVSALAKALCLDRDPVFVAQVVQTVMAKYERADADEDLARRLVLGMLLTAAADGKIDEREAAVLSALARTVPELRAHDVTALFDAAKTRMGDGLDAALGDLATMTRCKNKCFALAAEVALIAGRGPEGTLLPRLREHLAPDADYADSAIATFAAKYA
jgi:uncharacterized membrane protein YebE (DUF533 family)